MKKVFGILIGLGILSFMGLVLYLGSISAKESYPEDDYLEKSRIKRALIITAHDDDDVACAGTITKLTSTGWDIKHICLGGDKEREDRFKVAVKEIGISGVDFVHVKHRNDLDTNKKLYMPIAHEQWNKVYNHDSVFFKLQSFIFKYAPEVIFTLDDSVGAYGNSDHIFVSKLILEICTLHKNDPNFSVRRIYQSVYPNSMENAIMGKDEIRPYHLAKKIYNCKGMPEPSVEVSITKWAKNKKNYYDAYGEHELKNIKKFVPWYNWLPAWIYFRIFDREFYRVIEVNKP